MHRGKFQLAVIVSLLQLSSFICAGHECGNNPLRQVLLVAKTTGRTLGQVLSLLKEIDNPSYENLSLQFKTYATCVGLVDTGYFRKRSSVLHPRFHLEYHKPEKESQPNPANQMPFYSEQKLEHRPQLFDKRNGRKINVDRLKKWLYGPYRNYMNSYYLRWNLLWPLVNEE